MATAPVKPDQPTIDSITGTSFRIHATPNTINNGNGGAALTGMVFGVSMDNNINNIVGVDSTTNLTAEHYYTETQVYDTNLNAFAVKPNTTYYVTAGLSNSVGTTYSNLKAVTTAIAPMGTPTAQAMSAITANSMLFNLDSNTTNNSNGSPLDNAELRYSTSSAMTNATVIDYVSTGLTYTVTGLTRATKYYFQGRTHNAAGWSAWSNIVNATTLATAPNPPAPISVTNITQYSFEYRFATDGDDGGSAITGYDVGYGTSPTTPQTITAVSTGDNTFVGLNRYTTYYVWSRAKNAMGTSAWSTSTSFTTLAYTPAAPTPTVLDTPTQTTLHYVFADSSDNGGAAVDSRQVGYGTDATTPQTTISATNDQVISGLLPATTYYVWSRTHNVQGWGPWSTSKTAKTIAGTQINVQGVWVDAIPMVRTNGVWKIAQPYVNSNGTWKKTG